jgi:hypothetical protein
VKRKDVKEAVEEFLQADASRTRAADGQRAQLSAKYAYNREIQLRRFAATFPNTAPSMVHTNHKGLATKAEAEKWFAVAPSTSAKNVITLPAVLRNNGP